ncbi:hypothetical protein CGZ96_12590 [Enemella evansiae]|uniref:DUF6498-containing protein n=1 Tax=Enemella evansiae TaxID=2016499 RepID=UPI000B969A51|nr:DUF6498-containing protein [Enemella evansiae]OYN97098.1 hypothetical protein CGZ96_12590 [Enemella evansiae]
MTNQPYLAQPGGSSTPGDSGTPQRAGLDLSVLGALLLSLVANVATLIGVVYFGWPPGNVFLLFWIENVIVGLTTIVKIVTARGRGSDGGTGLFQSGNYTAGSVASAIFFCLHYGLFCLIHLVFTGILAYRLGIDLTWLMLGLPTVLIAVRYTIELITNWFGAGVRDRVTPGQPMVVAYTRIVVLQVAVILGSGVGGLDERLGWFTKWLPQGLNSPEVAMVILLLGLKTIVDLGTTIFATRR